MLMNFKNCAEDEECPVPDEVREALLMFHNALLAHCGQSSSTLSSLPTSAFKNNTVDGRFKKEVTVSYLTHHSQVFILKKKNRRKKWIILSVGDCSGCWKG